MAASAPLLLPSPTGFTAFEVVDNPVLGGSDTLLRCSAASCLSAGQIPLAGMTQLIASSRYGEDHTLVALGAGVAVSHDGGSSFELMSTRAFSGAIVVPGPRGDRLVAVEQPAAGQPGAALAYSDDLGATWTTTSSDAAAHVGQSVGSPRLLRPGRLIAWAADASSQGHGVFVCSADGAAWSTCSPDLG
jgi:hypothetical protein